MREKDVSQVGRMRGRLSFARTERHCAHPSAVSNRKSARSRARPLRSGIAPRGIKTSISRREKEDDPSSDIVRIGTSPITNSAVSSQLSRHSDVDHHEHITDVLRFRVVMCAALLLWCVTVLLDWSAVRFVEHGSLGYFLFWRGVALVIMGLAVVRLFVGQLPSARQFQVLSYAIFCSAMLSASMLCLRYRGIASPYAHAFSVILVARAVALPSHYRQGIPAVLVPASVFPLTMLAAAFFLPAIRAQFRDPAQLSLFIQSVALVVCTGALTIAGGHRMWSLRRQVFEARNIGRYKLRRRIGSGGMGEVWQAYHPALRRDVALKILRAQQVSPNALSRFEREVRATSELQHPNTIRVFDCGVTEDGLWYYAMELLQGETLASLVAREGGLEPERAIKLLRQACRALAEAHARGIVHRVLARSRVVGAESVRDTANAPIPQGSRCGRRPAAMRLQVRTCARTWRRARGRTEPARSPCRRVRGRSEPGSSPWRRVHGRSEPTKGPWRRVCSWSEPTKGPWRRVCSWSEPTKGPWRRVCSWSEPTKGPWRRVCSWSEPTKGPWRRVCSWSEPTKGPWRRVCSWSEPTKGPGRRVHARSEPAPGS